MMDMIYVIVCDRWGKGNKYTLDYYINSPYFFKVACKRANEWNANMMDPDAYAYVSKIQYQGIRHIPGSLLRCQSTCALHLMTEYSIVHD